MHLISVMKTQSLFWLLLLIPTNSSSGDDLIYEGLPEGPVRFREDRQERIYLAVFGENGAIVRADDGDAQLWKRGSIDGFELTPDRNVWLVQDRRILRFGNDGDARPVDRTPSFRQDDEAGQLFASRWGDLWSAGGQAMRRQDTMFVANPLGPGPGWLVTPVADDPFGNCWAIAQHPGSQQRQLAVLSRERPNQWQLTGVHEQSSARWMDVCSDDVGSVWLTTETSVVRVDPQSDETGGTRIASPKGARITAITSVANRQIVVGFADGSIQELSVKSDSEPQWSSFAAAGNGPVRAMLHDRRGWLWVVRGDKLFRLESLRADWHDHWDEQPRLPAGNHDIAFARVEDRLYTAGGKTYFGWPASAWTNLDHIWSYDINAGIWNVEAPMLEPGKAYAGIAALGGEIWLLGGYFIDGSQTVGTATVEIYSPRSRSFRLGPPLDEPRGQIVALTLNDRLFAIGGGVKKMVSIAAGETTWQTEPPPPGPVAQASGCVLNGNIYVASGAGSQCPGLFVYDPQQQSWSDVRHPTDSAPQAPLCAAYQGQVWVMAGTGRGGARTATHIYAPNLREWQKGPDVPLPVSWGAATEVNGRLLIAGGAYRETRAKDYHNSDRAFLLREP